MNSDFIPAKESRPVINFFTTYTNFMLWRRFRDIHVQQLYLPDSNSKTVYFMNHHYWWDGLLPLYLNENRFKQKARALMEDKQMREYPFFSRIGAFSIDLDNTRSGIRSLRYAVESMKRPNSSLFIYPEGKITPVSFSKPSFKPGLSWLYRQLTDVDFVPVAFYISHTKSNKPDLYIHVGQACKPDSSLHSDELTQAFEEELHQQMMSIRDQVYQVRS